MTFVPGENEKDSINVGEVEKSSQTAVIEFVLEDERHSVVVQTEERCFEKDSLPISLKL